ncbi:sulfite exporter TauE/SafE family protein [Pseudoalteromonas rubra]|uniref:sulfite exporter TauE/SafE family protein n=1 Tax=Pseudoalteromonas rubra TaxID=43658 RepID=UPI0013EE6485|nr:sulfite exporter TauE/SafE family protein [Pseudoalteromonas rubra]
MIKQLRVGIQSHIHECSTDYRAIPLVGFIGGLCSGLVGSGADILIFSYLVLMLKKHIKVATATSESIMAVTSVVGTFTNIALLHTLTPDIQLMVHAAIPVVIIGAPLGALVCAKLPERGVVNMLLLLIALETGFTAYECVRLYLSVSRNRLCRAGTLLLYVMLEGIYCREIVGHEVHDQKSGELAATMLEQTLVHDNALHGGVVLH